MQPTASRTTVAAPAARSHAHRRAFAPAAARVARPAAPRRQLRCQAASTEVKASRGLPSFPSARLVNTIVPLRKRSIISSTHHRPGLALPSSVPLPPTCPPPASHSEPSLQADAKYPSWESIYAELSGKYGTRTVTPEEAFDMAQLGNAVVIDVRPKEDFDKARGAVGVTECRLSGKKKL